jgi:hypothetical protein
VFYVEPRRIGLADVTFSWLYRQSLRDDVTPRRLPYPGEMYPNSVSPDGAWLYVSVNSAGETDISRLRIDGRSDSVERVVATPASEGTALVSPDGRWLAYGTSASGTYQTVIAPLSAPTRAIPIGTGLGWPIGWARNGRLLFHFLEQSGELWSVEIGPSGPLPRSARRRYALRPELRSIGLMPDGDRLVAVRGGPIYQDIILAQGALAGSAP